MKKVTDKEYKKVLIDLLLHFDKVCRKNGIKYSLIGGALIGAVRDHGLIPWDDDIDVILTPEEYNKLMAVKDQLSDGTYKLMDSESCPGYYFIFPKLVDTRTIAHEKSITDIEGYGIFLDIFHYYHMPDNLRAAKRIYRRLQTARKISSASYSRSNHQRIFKLILAPLSKIVGYKNWIQIRNKILSPKNVGDKYFLSNWPVYSFEKELQLAEDFNEYIDCDLEGYKVMIAKGYDGILHRTFGNYMELPPKEKRVSQHLIDAYWK